MKISEMKVGQIITEDLCLADATLRKTKGNPPSEFLSMNITDGTDTLDGKIWNYAAKGTLPESNKVYTFTGTVGEFAGKKQLIVTKMPLALNQDLARFSCTYFADADILWKYLTEAIQSIKDKHLHNITEFIYNKYKSEIISSSSAKAVHHVGIGGNACHTIEVYEFALRIVDVAKIANEDISMDLVKAGALLHDIGKIFVYKVTGPAVDYTYSGQLFDHIIVGLRLLNEAIESLGEEYVPVGELLAHIIASHHGQLEYGSPVTPKFVEAYIVNFADGISASLDTLNAANTKAEKEGKEMTDKVYTLNNREHILQKTVYEVLLGIHSPEILN